MVLSLTPVATRQLDAPVQADDEFGIYIHIPFCSHICPYCDFNTYAGQSARIPAYVEAVRRNCGVRGNSSWAAALPRFSSAAALPHSSRQIQIRAILATCSPVFELASGRRNHDRGQSQQSRRKILLRSARCRSKSPQHRCPDVRPARSARVGRLHEAEHVSPGVLGAARRIRETRVSTSSTAGQVRQSTSGATDLEPDPCAVKPAADHRIISPSMGSSSSPVRRWLTRSSVDSGARRRRYGGRLPRAGDVDAGRCGMDPLRNRQLVVVATAASRHNAIYWRNGDYAGIGAGAHGHVRNRRTMNQPSPGRYIASLQREERALRTSRKSVSEQPWARP